jgi:hypothetical protein
MSAETSIYHDATIHVTNLRAMLQGRTYAMANVTSVSMYTAPGKPIPGYVLAVVGALFLFAGFGEGEGAGCAAFLGVVLLVTGILYAISQKNVYWVRIGSASGETNALSSRDRDYIEKIVAAMNDAIVMRG